MSETKTFSVEIPEKPTGKAIATCFDSLISQMVAAGVMEKRVSRLQVKKDTKRIEIEVKEA